MQIALHVDGFILMCLGGWCVYERERREIYYLELAHAVTEAGKSKIGSPRGWQFHKLQRVDADEF